MSLLDRCTLSFAPGSLMYLPVWQSGVWVYSRRAGRPGSPVSRYGIMTAVSVFLANQRALV
jgi:hypothetical protein